MITVIIRFEVIAERSQEFALVTSANIMDRTASCGAVKFELYQCKKEPNHFWMVEVFESQEAIDAYYATEAHRAWEEIARGMLIEATGSDHFSVFTYERPGNREAGCRASNRA